MKVTTLDLPEVILIETEVHADERGWFREFWNLASGAVPGMPTEFVQDNLAFSHRGVLRGLHFQLPFPQGKLITVVQGEIFDVAVDIRPGSATFAVSAAVRLQGGSGRALYVPPGFAHGYQVVSESAHVLYKTTEFYHPECEHTIAWDDPRLAIRWPIEQPVLSAKDRAASPLADLERKLGG